MANVVTNNEYYTAIANAIRAKNGTTDTYSPSEMAAAISAISGGDTTIIRYDNYIDISVVVVD